MDELDIGARERTLADPFFVDAPADLRISVPFHFSLVANGGSDGRAARDIIQLMVLTDALERFWGDFARDVCRTSTLGPIALHHPTRIAAGIGPAANSGRFAPRPRFNVAFDLANGADLVRTGAQVYAVAIKASDLDPTLTAVRSHPPSQFADEVARSVLIEFHLDECDFWIGSEQSSGKGGITIGVAGLIIALASFLGGQTYMEEAYRRHEISHQISGLGASPCYIQGEITLDRNDLMDKATAILTRRDRIGICARQEMLVALGIYPGPVDGIEGKETLSALFTFRSQWNLQQPADPKHPTYDTAFAAAAIKALGGKKPGS